MWAAGGRMQELGPVRRQAPNSRGKTGPSTRDGPPSTAPFDTLEILRPRPLAGITPLRGIRRPFPPHFPLRLPPMIQRMTTVQPQAAGKFISALGNTAFQLKQRIGGEFGGVLHGDGASLVDFWGTSLSGHSRNPTKILPFYSQAAVRRTTTRPTAAGPTPRNVTPRVGPRHQRASFPATAKRSGCPFRSGPIRSRDARVPARTRDLASP